MNSGIKTNVRALSIFLLLSANACNSGATNEEKNPYDRLCLIYEEELSGRESPGPEVFQRLSDRVDEEIPELEEHTGHLANLPKKRFYYTLKELAEYETGRDWECRFIADYYR